MFIRLYITKLKVLLRNKSMLFWTLIFPFVLGAFFQIAFSNIDEAFDFDIIDLAIVDNSEYKQDTNLKTIIEELSKENDNQLFNTKYVTKEEAEELLSNEEIAGYIIVEESKPTLKVKNNGTKQTIIKYTLDEYYQMNSVGTSMVIFDPLSVYNGALEILKETNGYVKDNSTEKIDFTVNYFYTLIAMACLYGSLIGLEVIKDCEANLSAKGARTCIAPVNKMKIILSGLLAGYTIQVIAMALLLAFLRFVFDVNLDSNLGAIMLLASIGCLAGTSLGTFVGVSNKKTEASKIGLLIAVVMAFCFLSGMMGDPQLRVTLDENLPFIQAINPVKMIVNGLYSLFAYDTLTVYYSYLLRIALFAIIMIILTFIFVRRKNYDSI